MNRSSWYLGRYTKSIPILIFWRLFWKLSNCDDGYDILEWITKYCVYCFMHLILSTSYILSNLSEDVTMQMSVTDIVWELFYFYSLGGGRYPTLPDITKKYINFHDHFRWVLLHPIKCLGYSFKIRVFVGAYGVFARWIFYVPHLLYSHVACCDTILCFKVLFLHWD